ncbi:MAG TPA: TldD/PmbA family protein [Gemmatimonadaceae bacterium]|nr:TldD/PmbA family protein [Gemmatimonadaceae bacterium]
MSRPRSLFTQSQAQYLSREEAQRIGQQALRSATADETRIGINSGARANTRFAENQISTAGDNYNATVTVRSVFGRRVASASTNRLDDASLAQVVQRSEALARLAPEDPENMPELGPQEYQSRPQPSETSPPSPAQRAEAVRAISEQARAASLVSTGFIVSTMGASSITNSKGLFAYHRSALNALTTTVRTPDGTGSGWAGATHNDWAQMNAAELGQIAIEKAIRSRDPAAIEPGRYTVVLEPTAVANLVQLVAQAIGARNADEGRSFFSKAGGGNKVGEKIVDERVTIVSDPNDPDLRVGAFTFEGMPTRRAVWIENGIVRNLNYDRYWAQRQSVEPTASPGGFRMSGGDASIADMVASTQRGILVTRFWYIRPVDPRTILYTGLTRDGTFLIENGRVTRAIKNMRWNESPIFLLNNVELLGRPVRVNSDESGDGSNVIVPPVKARDFNFTSLSDAV